MNNFSEIVNIICAVADLIRRPYKTNQCMDVMLPIIMLRPNPLESA